MGVTITGADVVSAADQVLADIDALQQRVIDVHHARRLATIAAALHHGRPLDGVVDLAAAWIVDLRRHSAAMGADARRPVAVAVAA